ncbi:MAG: phosphotransferase family protein [Dehalococcoidia bacterium]|jgi:aminoglycoside phosphotransferase (APT) family kinase protein|nr:phosphotransferase family protein [Dehalococcoidia bacterium]MDW8009754.1 phosphotransferase family protein [Chloroflexota bacterium]
MGKDVPGIKMDNLVAWFRANVAEVQDLEARLIGHGRSNLTYKLEAPDGRAWVLRRPPLSHVQPTAHDMAREFRVLSALKDTEVPVPRPLAFCGDAEVIGAQFYIMEFVDGFVPSNPQEVARRYDEAQRRRMAEELIDDLVKLHAIRPDEVGLSDFGRPEGYLARQVRRFSEQWQRIKYREVPELDELCRRLNSFTMPESDHSIVHGDYRLDNAILDEQGHIIAILDWEMATLGDPLADLGMLRMYWARGEDDALRVAAGGLTALPGFPSWEEVAQRYAQKSGRDLVNLDYYIVLAHFKLAVILENMYARYLAGGTVGEGFELVGEQAINLARRGLEVANRSNMPQLRGEQA